MDQKNLQTTWCVLHERQKRTKKNLRIDERKKGNRERQSKACVFFDAQWGSHGSFVFTIIIKLSISKWKRAQNLLTKNTVRSPNFDATDFWTFSSYHATFRLHVKNYASTIQCSGVLRYALPSLLTWLGRLHPRQIKLTGGIKLSVCYDYYPLYRLAAPTRAIF